ATEACRRAANGRAFLDRVARETGLGISIISGREEAELALESCTPFLASRDRRTRALLFDIGGGSTEIAWVGIDGTTPRLISFVSAPVGVVTLAEQYGASIHTPLGYEAMVAQVRDHLRDFEAIHCIGREIARDNVRLLGTSGTVTTLAGLALGLERYSRVAVDGLVLGADRAEAALDLLRSLDLAGLRAHPCVGRDRADYVMPGCAIFDAIRRTWPADAVTVADRGLRDGMLLRMIRDAGIPHHGPPRPLSTRSRRPGSGQTPGALQT
ncbi:Ppx/GppA phosphatase family protein, partial [Ameyamaea chiangmaiensis]